MIIVVSGDNFYGCKERLNSLLKENSDELSASSIDMSEQDSLDSLAERVQGSSLFSDSETLVIKYLEDEKAIQDKALEIIKDAPSDNILIIYAPGLKAGNPFVKKISKVADNTYIESELSEHELSKWVTEEAKNRGGEINPATARQLIEYVGIDQLTVSNELDKLIAFNPKISKQSIENVAVPSPKTTIFQMLDAMLSGRAEKALSYLADLKAQQFDEMYIMSMIAWQANALSVAVATKGQNQTEVAKKTGVSAFVLRKSADATRKLSRKDVIELNEYILETDQKLKTAPTSGEQLIEQLIRRVAFIQS